MADVDDTYLGAPPKHLYKYFHTFKKVVRRECDLTSKMSKVKAMANSGGVKGIPQSYLDQQGGEILFMKVVGAFVPANAPGGIEACITALTKVMTTRTSHQLAKRAALHSPPTGQTRHIPGPQTEPTSVLVTTDCV